MHLFKRFRRVSLKGLLIAVALLTVVLGIYARGVRTQKLAIEWIVDNGGEYGYGFQHMPEEETNQSISHLLVGYLRSKLGTDFIDRVDYVDLSDVSITGISPLRGLKGLKFLYLKGNPSLTNISPIDHLEQIEALDLSNTGVSDFRALCSLPALRWLELSNTDFSDLGTIANSVLLETLIMEGTKVQTLNVEGHFPNVSYLDLTGSSISDLIGIAQRFPDLQYLVLKDTSIKDLEPVRELGELVSIDISGTKVTDLSPLLGSRKLKTIVLNNTNVALESIRMFRSRNADCYIELEFDR